MADQHDEPIEAELAAGDADETDAVPTELLELHEALEEAGIGADEFRQAFGDVE